MNISEVCRQAAISPDTLRYYEKIGLVPPVGRTAGGRRDYGEADLRWIKYVKCMRSAGLTIEQLVRYIQLFQQGDETVPARKAILQEQRTQLVARMAELQKALDMLNHKLTVYDSRLLPVEQKLVQTREIPHDEHKDPQE